MHFVLWRLEALLLTIVIFAFYLDLMMWHWWMTLWSWYALILQFRLLCPFTCVTCHLCLHDALHQSLLAHQWLHSTLDVIACEFMHLSSLYWSCMLHSPWIADWLFTCHVHFALSNFEFILWIVVILVLYFDPLPMSDWQLHVHGAWHNLLLMIVS